MKRRNRANRSWTSRKALPNLFGKQDTRKRKAFSFEQLEQRFAFSVAPLDLPTTSYSNDTPEGAAAIFLRELQWAALQSASANGSLDLTTLALPSDPFFPNPLDPTQPGQWHLLNIGQPVGNPDFQDLFGVPGEDINVVPAWNLGFTGEGVLVAVLDDGIQFAHPDLWANMSSEFAFNAFNGTNNANPTLLQPSHGTAVAGLIGATWSFENGVPVTGGVGVAPGVTLVPIKMLGNDNQVYGTDPIVNAFRYALMVGVDVTNNSWGPAVDRQIVTLSPEILNVLRDSALFGRDGLGMINVFATGNSAGSGGDLGFPGLGGLDSAAYNPFINSRYVIGVTGVDHDGGYNNADGTITWYAEAGPNVLVAAPTGSNDSLNNIANDSGLGSGLWTTDLTGDFGYNAAADPITGIDDDRDFLEDTNYTSRFNGTSGSAPIVSGVIALMLDANPNLTYRDVQEILVRSSRQNAQFEFPETGGEFGSTQTPWQTNQMGPFRDPDSWALGVNRFDAQRNPLADPARIDAPYFTGEISYSPFNGNDLARQFGHYELQPELYTNGAGYTVAQGYGSYGELVGYGHGVVDAELAVRMAMDWHNLDQDISQGTEKTFTTFISPNGLNLPAMERLSAAAGFLLVPGGIGGASGFAAYWNEYFADPPAPFDPANSDSWPDNTRGGSYLDFTVPVNQQMNVEWVEVKITITGPPEGLDYLKINMTSPNGMQSELNHYYRDPGIGSPISLQVESEPADGWGVTFGSTLNDSDTFTWTFSTNRSWGESTNGAVIMDPYTGEPQAGPGQIDFSTGNIISKPILRDWELHIENWGTTTMGLGAVEVVWHGKSIAGGTIDQEWAAEGFNIPTAQRIQGFIGVDVDNDDEFSGIDPNVDNEWNNRYIQTFFGDPAAPRVGDLQRRLIDDYQDNNNNNVFDEGDVREQEPFAENVLVQAFEFTVVGGVDVVNSQPIAQFLTGADGNYYFDLLPGNYIIRATDRGDTPSTPIDDPNTASQYRQNYKDEWRITADWFYAPDREDPTPDGAQGEILYDSAAQAPVAFRFDATEPRIPMAVTDINFLFKPQDTPANNVVVSGIVYADVNENGAVDIFDSPAGGMRVYVDANRDNQFNPGEQFVETNPDGTYSLTVLASTTSVIAIGVKLEPGWAPSIVGGDVKTLLASPGDVIANTNFFLNPPDGSTGSGTGNITGFVFSDSDADGVRDLNEVGLAGVRVFIDAGAMNGVYDIGEVSVITAANGGYFFANVTPGTHRIDVQIDNEGTPAATSQLTTPGLGYHNVTITAGQTRTGVVFGLDNLADKDYGDLPASYNVGGVPSHIVVPHFRLGTTVDGEVAGQASGADDSTDDGVVILGDGQLHSGTNTLQITVAGVGGFLSAWIDWNNNGQFEAGERLSFTDATTNEVLGTEADLGPGTHKLRIQAPTLVDGISAARFRWGEFGLTLGTQSFIGEVEDYFLATSSIALPTLPGDFNDDGGVNAADYVAFRKFLGTGASLPNTTNSAGPVVAGDEVLWSENFGETDGGGGGGGAQYAEAPPAESISTPVGALGLSSNVPTSAAAPVLDTPQQAAPSQTIGISTFSPLFASMSFNTISVDSFANDEVQSESAANEVQSNTNILLSLDQALAELDDNDTPLTDRMGKEEGYSDLELAAVFDDNTSWWSL